MLVGYARTSTEEQVAGLEAQIRTLYSVGCPEVCSEHISSVAEHRPALEGLMFCLSPGDTLVVTKLDRLARSVTGMWDIIKRLDKIGAHLRILDFFGGGVVDTKSPMGRLILTMSAGVAQFEREVMLERQAVGIVKAKADGKYTGRKSNTDAPAVVRLKRQGMSIREIAAQLEIGRGAVLRALGRQEAA